MRRGRRRQGAVLVAAALAAAWGGGCTVGPEYRRPALSVPDRTRGQAGAAEAASLADLAWWSLFRDDALKSLVDEALEKGYDVRLAAWRVEEARANAGIARSERYPQAEVDGGWSRSRQSNFVVPGAKPMNQAQVDLSVSWEIDLWGRVRRLDEAARARYLASEDARRGVLLSLLSEVATDYFQLRALDRQLEIATRTRDAFQGSYDLFNRRLEGGAASALETSSAEASLASIASRVPDLERLIFAKENEIAVLLGRGPGPIARGAALDEQFLPPEIPPGLPSDLLERRPDLREAEQQIVAANADVGVAVAELFPRISLTGAAGGIAPGVSHLFGDGRTWSMGAGLLAPIFQGGRLRQQRRAAVARWEQARVQYEQTVTQAFAEVSTALVAYQKLAEVERELARAVAADEKAVSLSNQRYVSGLSDYLEVLQAQQQMLAAENALAQTRLDRLTTLAVLYKALGGGWKDEGAPVRADRTGEPEDAPLRP